MKIVLAILVSFSLNICAMNVTTQQRFDDNKQKTEFLNRLAGCNILEHTHCQRVKEQLPVAFRILCERPQDSFANFLCDLKLVHRHSHQNSEEAILDVLECHGDPEGLSFEVFAPLHK